MRVKVPINISSEQKEYLGVISKRQLYYWVGILAIGYLLLPKLYQIFLPYFGLMIAVMVSLVLTILIVSPLLLCAHWYRRREHMYFDKYMYYKILGRKELGIWYRKEEGEL